MGVVYCFNKNLKKYLLRALSELPPLPGGWGGGYIVFSADPVGVGVGIVVHFFVSVRYLLNQILDFDQTCIYTM